MLEILRWSLSLFVETRITERRRKEVMHDVCSSFLEVPDLADPMPAHVSVIEHGGGVYEILCTPHYVGWYSLEMAING